MGIQSITHARHCIFLLPADLLPEDPYGQITVRQLMRHIPGIPEQAGGWQARIGQENRDVMEFLKKQETLEFEPGTGYAYSNNGFILLANMGDP